MTALEKAIKGIIVPLLTPFEDDDTLDLQAFESHINWLINRKVSALMPCGTTGEGPLLNYSEKTELIKAAIEISNQRVPVIAHIGGITTKETVSLAKFAESAGANAISVITPYFYKLSHDALVIHYTTVAKAVPKLPVYLYTIPQRTTNDIDFETAKVIVDTCANIKGIKDSSGNLKKMMRFATLRRGTFQVICGSDGLLLEALKLGALGGVSGNANAFPEVVVNLYDDFIKGNLVAAQYQQNKLDTIREILQDGANIALIKTALSSRGIEYNKVRPPLINADSQSKNDILERLLFLNLNKGNQHDESYHTQRLSR